MRPTKWHSVWQTHLALPDLDTRPILEAEAGRRASSREGTDQGSHHAASISVQFPTEMMLHFSGCLNYRNTWCSYGRRPCRGVSRLWCVAVQTTREQLWWHCER